MLSSLQVGLNAALVGGASVVVFTPVDTPLAGSEAVTAILAATGDWIVPVHDGHPGHPVAVSARASEALVQAYPTTGWARDVLAAFDRVEVPVSDPGVCKNINTPADVAAHSGFGEPK